MAPRSRRGKRRGEKPHTANDVEGQGFSKHLNPMAWVRAFNCNSVYVLCFRSMKVPISVQTSYNKADLRCLVDSGATDNFIHLRFVRRMKLGTRELAQPKKLYNIDDTTNKAGNVTHYVDLMVETAGRKKEMRFLVSNVG